MNAVAGGVPVSHVLYLHGFRSSPLSTKAQKVAGWFAAHRPEVVWCCPQLPASPRAAFDRILQAVDGWPPARMAVIGSSLGGYYATALAERTGCRAALLNPAVHPARDLAAQVGVTTAWHSADRFEFRAEYIDEVRKLEVGALSHPERCLAIIAKGDEVLSWREMTERYRGSRIKLLEGSDHALSDFDEHLPDVLRFLGLGPVQ